MRRGNRSNLRHGRRGSPKYNPPRAYSPQSTNSRKRLVLKPEAAEAFLRLGWELRVRRDKRLRSFLPNKPAPQQARAEKSYTPPPPRARAFVSAIQSTPTMPNEVAFHRGQGLWPRGFDLGFTPTPLKEMRRAWTCVKRKLRRELVFATGFGGSRRNVVDRAPPSKVRC